MALTLFSAVTASADITFDLSNVQLESFSAGTHAAGTLTGSFTTNNALNALTAVDITASASTPTAGVVFASETYTLVDSTLTNNLPSFFQLDLNPVTGTQPELRLIFSGGLTSTGASITTNSTSYEFQDTGGSRFVDSGSVAPAAPSGVPEPASSALILAGLIPIAFYAKRRYRKA